MAKLGGLNLALYLGLCQSWGLDPKHGFGVPGGVPSSQGHKGTINKGAHSVSDVAFPEEARRSSGKNRFFVTRDFCICKLLAHKDRHLVPEVSLL